MTASPLEAAFVNGMLAQSDETDASNEYSQSHPGCAVVPAALAAGEKFGADGLHFLRAVTLGYDIGPRVTISFGAVDFRDNSHKSTHAIAELFGAAAAAGLPSSTRNRCAGCSIIAPSNHRALALGRAIPRISRSPSSSPACRRGAG